MKRAVLAVAVLLTPASLMASEHFWVIGGGPDPQSSQAQIEFNVAWVVASLRELVPDAVVHIFFANGESAAPSIVEHVNEPDASATGFEPIARVFGREDGKRLAFRSHRVRDVEGSTRADLMVPQLERQLGELVEGDQAMIIYNGHGAWAPDRANNSLRLWGETRLDVREFEALLSRVDTAVPVRFLFTQCYSGAFERAVHPEAADVLELTEARRCGFFAESDSRQSEGCSASIEVGDYRDYTTYFFAALTGRTRLGEAITGRVDWDGDSRISPFDAHLFALVEGRNADLPRSTSEVYLERWLPWYSRWVGTDRIPDNLYGRAARQIARANGLREDGAALGAEMARRHDEVVTRIRLLTGHREEASAQVASIRERIQREAAEQWPTLDFPYTAEHHAGLDRDLADIGSFIRHHADYPELVRLQGHLEELAVELIEAERDLTQLEKLRRVRVLARALDQLGRHGSDRSVEAYERLRSCEALPLGP